MKASELIKELQALVDQFGDHEVQTVDDDFNRLQVDGLWYNPVTEQIKISTTPYALT